MRVLRALPLIIAAVFFAWRAIEAWPAEVWWRVAVSSLGALGFIGLATMVLLYGRKH